MSEASAAHLNTQPLSTPISRAALRTYRAERIRRGGVPWNARRRSPVEVWRRLTSIVATVGTKTLRQTVRYADDRAGSPADNVIAPAGRRLRQRPGASAGIAAFLVIAIAGGVLLLVNR